jgi:predicted peroxiredoxin
MRQTMLVSSAPRWPLQVAAEWKAGGDDVTVVLLDRAVAAARNAATTAEAIRDAQQAGVTVLAEQAALERRGLPIASLADGVKVTNLDELSDLLLDGADRVVWL